MESVSESQAIHESPNGQLRRGVLRSNVPHVCRTSRLGDFVRHGLGRTAVPIFSDFAICKKSYPTICICREEHKHVLILSPTARATGGGNALPTCRYAAVFLPENCQLSGKPWIRATILTVSLGIPTNSASGASSAIPSPSTPKA